MTSKSPITCHVLDSSLGKPAEGIKVKLLIQEPSPPTTRSDSTTTDWVLIKSSVTNEDGRCSDLFLLSSNDEDSPDPSTGWFPPPTRPQPGVYQIVFETKEYFERTDRKSFYPFVQITFSIENPSEHYHVPLLISPFSYTTYRGS